MNCDRLMFTNLTKLTLLVFLALPAVLFASDGSAINSGDTAWIITATALVLLMTLPGLALFYGGLVRSKNYLSVLMHKRDINGASRLQEHCELELTGKVEAPT